MLRTTVIALACLTATLAFAEGDPEKGETAFRKCQACHIVENDAGEVLAGRNARTGPNLYGIAGQTAAARSDFKGYSGSLKEAAEKGLTWTEENFIAWTQDASAFLKEYLDDPSARSKMAFRERDPQEAADLFAYLQSLADPEGTGE
jgi:cytochrome c